MCKIVEEIVAQEKIEVFLGLFSRGLLPAKVAAEELSMPVEQFLELAKQEGATVS